MKEKNIKASFPPCKFRAGVLHLMLNQNKSSRLCAPALVVADIVGDFKQTFAQIDINGDLPSRGRACGASRS